MAIPLLGLFLLLGLPLIPGEGGAGAPAAVPAQPKAAAQAEKLKTLFKNLRFEEDWTALADESVETDHWLPQFKHSEPAPGWSTSFGGQFRYRYMDESNRSLKGTVPGHNTFSLRRVRLHGEVRAEDHLRLFVEILDAGIRGEEAPPLPIDRQNWDIHNAFIELLADPELRLRLGRTELQYGAQRLVSPLDWGNTRRTFQGGVLQIFGDDVQVDVFATHPVAVDPRGPDDVLQNQWFRGAWASWTPAPGRTLDAFLLALNDDDRTYTAGDGGMGRLDLYTAGLRALGKSGDLDGEAEAAWQFGDRAGDRIDAWAWTLRGGVTLPDAPFAPRLGLDLDFASGDRDATDSKLGTFQQLFPLGHAWLGYLDLVGRQNIFAVMPNVTLKTTDTTSLRVAWAHFELVSDSDALYNAAGKVSLIDPTGASGSHVGDEWDLTLVWKPRDLAPHGEFLFGWSHFRPGRFVDTLGDGESATILYAQYSHTF